MIGVNYFKYAFNQIKLGGYLLRHYIN